MDMIQKAIDIFTYAVAAVNPATLMLNHLGWQHPYLVISGDRIELSPSKRLFIIGAGKAAALMAQTAEDILGDQITGGIVVTKHGHGLPLKKIKLYEAGHPIPDENSVKATEEIISLANSLTAQISTPLTLSKFLLRRRSTFTLLCSSLLLLSPYRNRLLTRPLPIGRQPITAFGAAANLIHPATGYSLARSLREAPGLAKEVSEILQQELSIEETAQNVWNALWPPRKRRQVCSHPFSCFHLSSLCPHQES
ncbi:MAG: DUF4147 domain-containing protein [Sphingobacteriales bacterium]|nr:MAG: DUF4147 domain-containing protein [Sphingobacteriales bacterium]